MSSRTALAISSMRFSVRSASFSSKATRSSRPVSDHASKASFAAATATSTSLALLRVMRPRTSSFAGLITFIEAAEDGVIQSPLTENAPGFLINGLKREQLIATNSMILHEVFFDGLGDESEPEERLKNALARDFGSYDRWRAEFIAMGKALGGGSGWVLLSWSPRDGKLVNQWAPDHCHTLAGGTPILALDMYEHSYHWGFRRR